MKRLLILLILFTLVFSMLSAENTKEEYKNLPNVTVLTTGGTIAGRGSSETGSEYTAGKLSGEELIEALPELQNIAHITVEEISNVPSQDMTIEIWLKLAKRINEIFNQSECDGIVITHGTDTMEETAYFLNLTVHSEKPIVITGSMRPSTSISADGDINLYNAVAVAASKKSYGRGVLILMNDEIYNARDASKSNTVNVKTFINPNGGPAGYAHFGEVSYYYKIEKLHTLKSEFNIESFNILPRVEIIHGYADSNEIFVDAAINAGVDGIVFAGVGDGNGSSVTLNALKEAVEKNISVVISSRTGSGIIHRNSEYDFDEYDFISADNLNPQKARILLMLALTETNNADKIQEYFYKY